MFGIGFTELLLISVIAILFLGPDKLPSALIEMAKFIKSVKKTIGDAKSSLEEEMKVADLKEEALNYRKQLDEVTQELKGFKNLSLEDLDDVTYEETPSPKELPESQTKKTYTPNKLSVEEKKESVTFKKKSTKKKSSEEKGDS